MNIGKKELVDQLKEKYGYTKKDASDVISDVCETIIENLKVGNTVSIYGFGCFDIVERAGRRCVTPQGDEVFVPAFWSPRFYPGDTMKRAVREWDDSHKRGMV